MNKLTFFPWLLIILVACDKMDITSVQADSFIKFYNTYPVFTGADVKEVNGHGFAVVGTVKSYTSGTDICLIRTNEYGNSLDSARYYGRSLDDEAYCLQVLSDGFAILGSSVNPVTEKKEAYFIRTDSLGNIIWSKFIGGTGDIIPYHFEVNAQGSFIMAGYADNERLGVLSKDIWLYGLDKNGNNIENWPIPRLHGGIKDDIATCLQLLDNGNIVLTGQTRSYPPLTDFNNSFVIITNATGGVISSFWIESGSDQISKYIRVVSNNSFIIAGTSNNTAMGRGTDIMMKKVTITTPSPKIDWDTTFGGNGNDYGESLILDNNFIHLLGNTSISGTSTSIVVITTNLNGNNPTYSYIGEGSDLTGKAFEKTPDEGFIITGTNNHSENNMSMALIKLKADGSF